MLGLHRAAYNGDADGAAQLLAAGAAVDERDQPGGRTPLLWACFRARVADMIPVIKTLVAAGADIDAATIGPGAENCLMAAARAGAEATVAALLALGADVNARADGVTALMTAATEGETAIVRLLLDAGADPNVRCGRYAASDYASYHGHDSLASELTTAMGA